MDEIGTILREAREMKNLSLGDVQEQIRINRRYLHALEEGAYERLPTPVHVRGFLRNYARFLELDPAPLLERYGSQQSNGRRARASSNGQPTAGVPQETRADQPFFNPVNVNLDGAPDGAESTVRLVIIVALLITIGLAASRFVPLLRGQGDGRDNLQAVVENVLADPEEADTETAEVAGSAGAEPDGEVENSLMPEATSMPLIPTGRNNPDAAATVAAAPTRPALPATLERIHLQLDITERTWMRVTIDGEIVFEDQVTQEDGPFEWEAESEASLLTGNAAGIFVTINETQLGKLGGRGEVADESWQTTSQ